jgi:hypothetical protein
MEIPKINGNGKNWLAKGLVQALIIVGLVAYIAVEKIGAINNGSENRAQNTVIDLNSQRLARLEECIITLRPLPSEVAGMKVALDGVKSTVDKIEKKLDTHIDK